MSRCSALLLGINDAARVGVEGVATRTYRRRTWRRRRSSVSYFWRIREFSFVFLVQERIKDRAGAGAKIGQKGSSG